MPVTGVQAKDPNTQGNETWELQLNREALEPGAFDQSWLPGPSFILLNRQRRKEYSEVEANKGFR